MAEVRQRFGIEALDEALGGGLLPGTLTVLAGATGVGKTQLGLQWGNTGVASEGYRGVLCDLTSRGDSQNHAAYAKRLCGWDLKEFPLTATPDFEQAWDLSAQLGDYFHPIQRSGRRVTRGDLEDEQWHEWKGDLARIFRCAVGYFYQHFVRGCRRVVFDGLEPSEKFSDSIQFEFFEYIYHHVLRKEDEWVAREWFREKYRANEAKVLGHRYEQASVGCLYLYTTPHVMLDELLCRPIAEGDIFSNANTIIMMGRTLANGRLGRALAVVKHRGSACREEIIPYHIEEQGLVLGE